MMATHTQSVTPEELDAWLQTTEVTEEEEGGTDLEPLPVDVPAKAKQNRCPKKKGSWRRRSSLDEENISSRPCFGVDAETLLADVSHEAEGENNARYQLDSYRKRSSEGSSTVVASNIYPQSPEFQKDIMLLKKRRVSFPTDIQDESQFSRQSSSYSNDTKDTPYFRLVTDDSFKLDNEARFSRHSAQFSVPSHTMDQEARFSRRSSQFTVTHDQSVQGVESFLRAMEISQRSHSMLMSHRHSLDEGRRSDAMRESGESRNLLVRISRRNVARSMTSGINSKFNSSYHPTSSSIAQQSNQDRVVAGLRRMENMLRVEQQLAGARSEFM